jgi:choline dehydrogenase
VHRAPFGEAFLANVVQRLQTGQPVKSAQQLVDPHIILTLPGLLRPLSRGWVQLRSSDPTVPPDISANYGGEPIDVDRLVTMVEIGRRIYASQAFAELGLKELSPGPAIADTAQLREWVIDNTGSYYHFVGSCKMGIDRQAVVDPHLKVYGANRLRVADGSIMPTIPSANTHTTIVMIGERAADCVKAS